jgi:hypothetical protein
VQIGEQWEMSYKECARKSGCISDDPASVYRA